MENKSIIQQSKSDPGGRAVASLVLGVISGVLLFIPGLSLFSGVSWIALPALFNFILILPLTTLIALIGLIFGIIGLKSTKRKFTIVGIVLCVLVLIAPILFIVLIW